MCKKRAKEDECIWKTKYKKMASHCTNQNIKFGHIVYIFTTFKGGLARRSKAEGYRIILPSCLVRLLTESSEHVYSLFSRKRIHSSRRMACACIDFSLWRL